VTRGVATLVAGAAIAVAAVTVEGQ